MTKNTHNQHKHTVRIDIQYMNELYTCIVVFTYTHTYVTYIRNT